MNSVHVDGWTSKWAIIASNVNSVHVDDGIAEWEIIACNVTTVNDVSFLVLSIQKKAAIKM